MKDRIEIEVDFNKKGKEILKFYVHCDFGLLWLFNKPKTKGVYQYFITGKSINELREYKYNKNKALNKIIDRLPAYVKYAKQIALEERVETLTWSYEASECIHSFSENIA